jgi:hypothetical protein
MLLRYLAIPRIGYLDEVLHVFAYLKQYNRSTLVLDDTAPQYDESQFMKCDWPKYYPGAAEAVPHTTYLKHEERKCQQHALWMQITRGAE